MMETIQKYEQPVDLQEVRLFDKNSMMTKDNSNLAANYVHESEYAYFLNYKREQYPNLLELVEIKTPWPIVEEILQGVYSNVNERIEHSLAYDTLRVMAANLW